MLLEGKVALITGAARGIGRTTALLLADEGADVGLVDRLPEIETMAGQIQDMGRRTKTAVLDIADSDQVLRGTEKIQQELGDIDILVNNAGIVNNIAPMVKMTHEAWSREIAVNLSGAFNMIKAVIGPMIEKKWGRIINFSSLGATGGLHYQVGYAASKAGLLGLTKTIALEHARDGITCNAVVPGLIGTEMVHQMPKEIKQGALANIPAGRIGKMEEVGHLVTFLASERAGYINGEEIHIDGGMRLNVSTLGSRKALKEKGMEQKI
jgi:NAD(P)-dependent dehydrogenase (short-subunit alcohol dehydrogenase family)